MDGWMDGSKMFIVKFLSLIEATSVLDFQRPLWFNMQQYGAEANVGTQVDAAGADNGGEGSSDFEWEDAEPSDPNSRDESVVRTHAGGTVPGSSVPTDTELTVVPGSSVPTDTEPGAAAVVSADGAGKVADVSPVGQSQHEDNREYSHVHPMAAGAMTKADSLSAAA
eukprot:scaffold154318_cov36-Prasinocladus_malaysianus.AAC.1